MSYQLQKKETVQKGFRRIAREQIDQAIAEVTEEGLDPDKAVHQVRKRCKKLRGLLRLVRPQLGEKVYQYENTWFRDTAQSISGLRDKAVLLQTFDKLLKHFEDQVDAKKLASVRKMLEQQSDATNTSEALAEAANSLRQARKRIGSWSLDKEEFKAMQGGLVLTYRRARKRMEEAYADPTDEKFHEWRKRVKYHWYHTRLLESIWPEMMQPRASELDELSDLLGDDHDLAVFRQTLVDKSEQFRNKKAIQTLLGLAEARQAELRTAAQPLGKRLFAEKPRRLRRRFGTYWKSWRARRKQLALV